MEFDATFLIAAISFIVFVFIMNAVFYAPVLKIMRERNSVVEDNFNGAKALNEETHKQEQYHLSELEASRNTARTELDSEMKRLKTEKSKIIADYKNELFSNTAKEKENLKQSALEAKEILKDNVVDIAKSISNIILGDNINSETINKSQVHIKEEQV